MLRTLNAYFQTHSVVYKSNARYEKHVEVLLKITAVVLSTKTDRKHTNHCLGTTPFVDEQGQLLTCRFAHGRRLLRVSSHA